MFLSVSGVLIQAYDKLLAQGKAEYYFFVSDDLILSPEINESNILYVLKMKNHSVFINDIQPLNSKSTFNWPHAKFSSVPFLKKRTQWKGSIPEYGLALELFRDFFAQNYKEEYENDFFGVAVQQDNLYLENEEIRDFIQKNGDSLRIPYPMAYGYSDIFMIEAKKLFAIARLCGVFSAMNMFAEISLPTAIALSVSRQEVIILEETGYKARCAWTDEERMFLEKEYQNRMDTLFEKWEDGILFVHPVKLSRWKLP